MILNAARQKSQHCFHVYNQHMHSSFRYQLKQSFEPKAIFPTQIVRFGVAKKKISMSKSIRK